MIVAIDTKLRLMTTAANVGGATKYALLAHAADDLDLACAWETIANDLTYLGRAIANDSWTHEAVEREARSIYARWDSLSRPEC